MRHVRKLAIATLGGLMALGMAAVATAQTFNSGSTGVDGAFNPPSSVPPGTTVNGSTYTVPLPASGIFNFTTITVPSGTTVTFARNATNTPVTLLASGDVTIVGTIDLSAAAGVAYQTTTATYPTGGKGGPGGYDGGSGETKAASTTGGGNGLGPGGGKGAAVSQSPSTTGCHGGGAGHVNAGATGYTYVNCGANYDGAGGIAYGNTAEMPLLGGSGGGGAGTILGQTGGGGGGGGGAILIASSGTLTLTGAIRVNGGAGGNGNPSGINAGGGGGGAGGAIRLMATTLAGAGGTLSASAGAGGTSYHGGYGGAGSVGRIRLESYNSTASWTISPSPTLTPPGSVQLTAMPNLSITSVAGVATPSAPTGSYSVPDVTLPPTTTSPVTVALAASNIPLGTTVTVTATPLLGAATTATSTGLSGTVASSTASATLSVSFNTTTVLTATATFTLLADAGGGPVYAEGEEVTHVRVAAVVGGPSSVTYLTRSGREIVVR